MDRFEKLMIYLAIATSFFGAQFATFSIGPAQVSTLRIILILLLGFICIHPPRIVNKNTFSLVVMSIMGIYSLFACIWCVDFQNWFRELYFIFLGIFFAFVIQGTIRTKREIILCVLVMEIMIQVQGAIGWYEIVTGDYLFISTDYRFDHYTTKELGVPIAMPGNPNGLAMMLLFGVFFSIFFARHYSHYLLKLLFWGIAVNDIYLLYATHSRANFLGFCVGLVLLFLRSKKSMIIALCFIAVLPFLRYIEGFDELFDFLSMDRTIDSDTIRLNLIKNGFYFLYCSYGFGVGLGQIEYHMKHEALYPVYGIFNIHNWWMEILVSFGIVFFVLYLIFLIRLAYSFFHRCMSEHDRLSQMFFVCMIAFSIASISASSNIVVEWLWMFWAICIAWNGIENKKEPALPDKPKQLKKLQCLNRF